MFVLVNFFNFLFFRQSNIRLLLATVDAYLLTTTVDENDDETDKNNKNDTNNKDVNNNNNDSNSNELQNSVLFAIAPYGRLLNPSHSMLDASLSSSIAVKPRSARR